MKDLKCHFLRSNQIKKCYYYSQIKNQSNLHFWKLIFSIPVHHAHGGDVQLQPLHVALQHKTSL